MNLIKSNLTGLLMMFAALCPNMTMAESGGVSFDYVEKDFQIAGSPDSETHKIGLYSFDLSALSSSEQKYSHPHKLIIAQRNNEWGWWLAVKYKRQDAALCGYIEKPVYYTKMTSIINNSGLQFLIGLKLEEYGKKKGEEKPLADKGPGAIFEKLKDKLGEKKPDSSWPDNVSEYTEFPSKQALVTALFEDCNKDELILLSDLQEKLESFVSQDNDNNVPESGAITKTSNRTAERRITLGMEDTISKAKSAIENMQNQVIDAKEKSDSAINDMKMQVKAVKDQANKTIGEMKDQAPKPKEWWFYGLAALIVLLIIIIVATGYWLYRKVTRMNTHSNLGKINADEFKKQIVDAQKEQTQVWDKKLNNIDIRLTNLTSLVGKEPSNEKPTDTRQQPKSPASPIFQEILNNKKLDEIEQQLKDFASPVDQKAWLKRQTEIDEKLAELAHLVNKDEPAALLKAYTGELECWLKQQIKQSIARGKIYNDELEKLRPPTGDYGLPENGIYDECNSNYKRCYENLSDSMQENRHATLPDRGISWMMGLLDEYFKSAHNLMLMLPRVTESGYQRERELTHKMESQQEEAATAREQQQKEAEAARKQQQKKAEAEHERQEQRYQRLEDQIGDLKKTNVQIYRQGGLRVKEDEERVSGRLAELGHLYTERGTVLQYARAIDVLRKRLRESESTDASFFRAVKLDVLLERLNQFDEFHIFYERDELSEFLIGHWQGYIQFIFRACLLLKSYFQLDPRHSILLDLNLARSAAAKLLDEHGLIPDDFELPAPSERFERKFEVTVHGEIPADLVSHAGFKDKVQALRKSGAHKVACYVSRWGLSSQDEALKNNDLPRTCLKSLEKSDVVVQGWGG